MALDKGNIPLSPEKQHEVDSWFKDLLQGVRRTFTSDEPEEPYAERKKARAGQKKVNTFFGMLQHKMPWEIQDPGTDPGPRGVPYAQGEQDPHAPFALQGPQLPTQQYGLGPAEFGDPVTGVGTAATKLPFIPKRTVDLLKKLRPIVDEIPEKVDDVKAWFRKKTGEFPTENEMKIIDQAKNESTLSKNLSPELQDELDNLEEFSPRPKSAADRMAEQRDKEIRDRVDSVIDFDRPPLGILDEDAEKLYDEMAELTAMHKDDTQHVDDLIEKARTDFRWSDDEIDDFLSSVGDYTPSEVDNILYGDKGRPAPYDMSTPQELQAAKDWPWGVSFRKQVEESIEKGVFDDAAGTPKGGWTFDYLVNYYQDLMEFHHRDATRSKIVKELRDDMKRGSFSVIPTPGRTPTEPVKPPIPDNVTHISEPKLKKIKATQDSRRRKLRARADDEEPNHDDWGYYRMYEQSIEEVKSSHHQAYEEYYGKKPGAKEDRFVKNQAFEDTFKYLMEEGIFEWKSHAPDSADYEAFAKSIHRVELQKYNEYREGMYIKFDYNSDAAETAILNDPLAPEHPGKYKWWTKKTSPEAAEKMTELFGTPQHTREVILEDEYLKGLTEQGYEFKHSRVKNDYHAIVIESMANPDAVQNSMLEKVERWADEYGMTIFTRYESPIYDRHGFITTGDGPYKMIRPPRHGRGPFKDNPPSKSGKF